MEAKVTPEETIKSLMTEKNILQKRLDKVMMELRLMVIKESAKNVNASNTANRR